MTTEFINLEPDSVNTAVVERVAAALREGALVAFPTETVYGLAANAANAESVRRLQAVKGRDMTQPFTVHVGRRTDCEAFLTGPPPAVARRLIKKGWPGPLTLILPVSDPTKTAAHSTLSDVGREAIYSEGRVGIRFPDHSVASSLLSKADSPIIASSANVSGTEAPVDGEQVRAHLDGKIDIVLSNGYTKYRKGSTIVAVADEGYDILREGVLDARTIQRLAGLNILFVCTGNTCRSPMAEGICKQAIAKKLSCEPESLADRGIVIRSAGTLGISAGHASTQAVEVCQGRGIDISSHRSSGVTVDLVRTADYILTMCRHHGDMVRSLAPQDAAKISTLDPNEDVPDPIGGTVAQYARVADMIEAALLERLTEVDI